MQDLFLQLSDFLNIGWDFGSWTLTLRMIAFSLLLIILSFLFTRYISGKLLNYLEAQDVIEEEGKKKIRSILRIIIGLGVLVGLLKILDLDFTFYTMERADGENMNFHLSIILIALMVFKFAQLLDWVIARILIKKYFAKREERELARKVDLTEKTENEDSKG